MHKRHVMLTYLALVKFASTNVPESRTVVLGVGALGVGRPTCLWDPAFPGLRGEATARALMRTRGKVW